MKKILLLILLLLIPVVFAQPIAETSTQIKVAVDSPSAPTSEPSDGGGGSDSDDRSSSGIICGDDDTCGLGEVCENNECISLLIENTPEEIIQQVVELQNKDCPDCVCGECNYECPDCPNCLECKKTGVGIYIFAIFLMVLLIYSFYKTDYWHKAYKELEEKKE